MSFVVTPLINTILIGFLISFSPAVNASNYNKNPMMQSHLDALSRVAPILGESAIVDKETGQVFWQGGKQSLFDSTVGHSYISNQQEGIVQHIRATLFSLILWMSFIRFVAEWALKRKILTRLTESMMHPSQRVLDIVRLLSRAMLICLACLPKFSRVFLILVLIGYVIESYTCSTRKYLSNALSCPEEVETYIENLRDDGPTVSWQIRCYHYEKRKWLCRVLLVDAYNYFHGLLKASKDNETLSNSTVPEDVIDSNATISEVGALHVGPSMLTRKVISHQITQSYSVGNWHDDTIGGLLKQAQASTTIMAAFTKISLYKLLLFANKETRVDYFKQQSGFIRVEGRKDEYAEFSTHLDVKGYKEKVLAVRPPTGVQKVFSVRYFWLFTMLGLTVPYRIRFGKHCDELRVAVVKEVTVEVKPEYGSSSLSKSSWFSSPRSWLWGPDTSQDVAHDRREKFKERMQEISLYRGAKEKSPPEPLMIIDAENTNSASEEFPPVELSNEDALESTGNLTEINTSEDTDVTNKSYSWLWGPDTRQDVVHDRSDKSQQRMQEISLNQGAKDESHQEPLMITDTENTNSDSEEFPLVELSNEHTQEPTGNLTQINTSEGIDVIDKSNASDIMRDDDADGKEKEESV